MTEVLNSSKTWTLPGRWSHGSKGIDTWASQKWKNNFLSTEPKEYCLLSLLLGSRNELWSWEMKELQEKKNNKVEFLLSLTSQCNKQTSVLASGVTYQQGEQL